MKSSKGSDSNILLREVTPKLPYHFIGKRSVPYLITLYASAFFAHIVHIILCIPNKEMRPITTRWPVTFMQAIKIVWNQSVMEFIRKSVCLDRALVYAYVTIPMLVVTSFPIPARGSQHRMNRAILVHLLEKTFFSRAQRSNSVVMSNDKANGLTGNMSKFQVVLCGDGGRFSAVTQTHAGRVRLYIWRMCSELVTTQIAKWLTFDPACFRARLCRQSGFFTTPTGAVSIGDFIKGKFKLGLIWGIMEGHKKFTFLVSNPGDVCASARYFYWSLQE